MERELERVALAAVAAILTMTIAERGQLNLASAKHLQEAVGLMTFMISAPKSPVHQLRQAKIASLKRKAKTNLTIHSSPQRKKRQKIRRKTQEANPHQQQKKVRAKAHEANPHQQQKNVRAKAHEANLHQQQKNVRAKALTPIRIDRVACQL